MRMTQLQPQRRRRPRTAWRPLATIAALTTLTLASPAVLAAAHPPTPVAAPAPAAAQAPPVLQMPSHLHDAADQFAGLSLRPDGLGFHIGDAPDPSMCRHIQGVARYHAPSGMNYMFASYAGIAPAPCTGDPAPGSLWVVRMESRDRTGERMRSNRFGSGVPEPPDPLDRVVEVVKLDGTDGFSAYAHPGGMQVIGDVLVLALEHSLGGEPFSRILFIDISSPENPTVLSHFDPPVESDAFSAGLVGIAPIAAPDGGVLYGLVVTGKNNNDVRFYRSFPTPGAGTSTELTSPALTWEEMGAFNEDEIEACIEPDWPTGTGAQYQTLTIVREGGIDGQAFMVAARNDGLTATGDDFLSLYSVELVADGRMPDCAIRHVRSTHVDSAPYILGDDSANMQAGVGAYVTPTGELIVYATEIENDGVGGTVRFGEYRHRGVVNGNNSPSLAPSVSVDSFVVDEGAKVPLAATGTTAATQAYIQLYEDDDVGDTFPGNDPTDHDWWVNVDYQDRYADDFDDQVALLHGAEESTGSWWWFAPVGCTIYANDYPGHSDEFPGPDTVALRGTGGFEIDRDLDSLPVYRPDPGGTWVHPVPAGVPITDKNYDDDVGGITFGSDCDAYYSAPIGVTWDLDGDSVFETPQPADFDATALDGPSTSTVAARAQHPFDTTDLGTSAPIPVEVTVRNVAPAITSVDLPGLSAAETPVALDATFTDPGRDDTQSATIDWGDGTTDLAFDDFTDARGGAIGHLRHDHAYAPGVYTVTLTVTDDDGGAAVTTRTVEVLTIEQLIERAVEQINDLLAAATDPALVRALTSARDELIGNHNGASSNGALDKLEAGNPAAAIIKVHAAIEDVESAEMAGAAPLDGLKDLLGLAAGAIARRLLSATGP